MQDEGTVCKPLRRRKKIVWNKEQKERQKQNTQTKTKTIADINTIIVHEERNRYAFSGLFGFYKLLCWFFSSNIHCAYAIPFLCFSFTVTRLHSAICVYCTQLLLFCIAAMANFLSFHCSSDLVPCVPVSVSVGSSYCMRTRYYARRHYHLNIYVNKRAVDRRKETFKL